MSCQFLPRILSLGRLSVRLTQDITRISNKSCMACVNWTAHIEQRFVDLFSIALETGKCKMVSTQKEFRQLLTWLWGILGQLDSCDLSSKCRQLQDTCLWFGSTSFATYWQEEKTSVLESRRLHLKDYVEATTWQLILMTFIVFWFLPWPLVSENSHVHFCCAELATRLRKPIHVAAENHLASGGTERQARGTPWWSQIRWLARNFPFVEKWPVRHIGPEENDRKRTKSEWFWRRNTWHFFAFSEDCRRRDITLRFSCWKERPRFCFYTMVFFVRQAEDRLYTSSLKTTALQHCTSTFPTLPVGTCKGTVTNRNVCFSFSAIDYLSFDPNTK